MNRDAQERSRIEEDLANNLYVEASAGTGKTTSLVSRICALVKNGADINQMTAITFTRAAASELRYRIRERFEELERNETNPESKLRYQSTVERLGSAAIQTIDSLALSLISEAPQQPNMPFLITPLDSISDDLRFSERWDEWVERELSAETSPLSEAMADCILLGLSNPLNNLKQTAKTFHSYYDLLQDAQFNPIPQSNVTDAINRLLPAARALSELAGRCEDETDKLFLAIHNAILPFCKGIEAAGSDREALLSVCAIAPKMTPTAGTQKNWGGKESKAEVAGCVSEIKDSMELLHRTLGHNAITPLIEFARRFAIQYAAERRDEGTPNFRDMLVWARDMLKNNPKVLEYFRERYRHVLVDEFQDTSPLQIELVELLGGTNRDGAFFAVGDPKQSIYRFRRADIQAVSKVRERLKSEGGLVFLETNYRSQREILEWVNGTFADQMPATVQPDPNMPPLQAEYHRLTPPEPSATGSEATPCIKLAIYDKTVGDNAGEIRRKMCQDVASLVLWAARGNCNVRERLADGKEVARHSRFGDVCIMFRTRGFANSLSDALARRQIPFVLEGTQKLYTSPWVEHLVNVLAAIEDPTNEVATVAALRSPFYGCSDNELIRWRKNGGSFDYSKDASEIAASACKEIESAFQEMKGLHAESRNKHLPNILEDVIRIRKIREIITLQEDRFAADNARRLLDLFVERSRSAHQHSNASLADFLRMVQERTGSDDASILTAEKDAVRCMTIHNAKGREFPIVILLESQVSNKDSVIIRRPPFIAETEVRLSGKFKISTIGFDEAAEKENLAQKAEEVRLAYVGTTRAKDHLFIGIYNTVRKAIAPEDTIYGQNTELGWPMRRDDNAEIPAARTAFIPDRNEWKAERDEVIKAAGKLTRLPATGLERDGFAVEADKLLPDSIAEDVSAKGRARTDFGKAVHAALQDAIGKDEAAIAKMAKEAAEAHGVPDRAAEVLKFVLSVLETRTVKHASTRRFWTEASVSSPARTGVRVSGIIDLVFEEHDGSLTIVDYKTDKVRGSTIEAKAKPYLMQMGAYAYALESSSGRAVSSAVLIFASEAVNGKDSEYRVPNITELSRSASNRIAEIAKNGT